MLGGSVRSDLDRHDSATGALPEEADLKLRGLGGKFLAVYAGSHGISDHLDKLLEAAGELQRKGSSHIHLLFVGDGPDKERFMAKAALDGLGNVSFLPPVPKSAVPALLERSGAGLISIKDASVYKWGMSFNKLYDYMAARLPTLLLGKPESNIVRSGGGLIDATPAEMADALERVAEDGELRAELGRKARAYVEEHHAWSSLSGKLLAPMKEDVRNAGQFRPEKGKVSAHEHG